jgi:hypothetical protein
MGCGCGGGRRNVGSRAASAQPQPQTQPGSTRVVQNQAARQALVQQAKERLMQNAPQNNNEAERKRRIQVSLRKRNQGKS